VARSGWICGPLPSPPTRHGCRARAPQVQPEPELEKRGGQEQKLQGDNSPLQRREEELIRPLPAVVPIVSWLLKSDATGASVGHISLRRPESYVGIRGFGAISRRCRHDLAGRGVRAKQQLLGFFFSD